VAAAPVPLNARDPTQQAIGNFRYAGGLALTSDQTSRLHGLSDLEVGRSGRLLAVGDEGDLVSARLTFDQAGRPAGLAEARIDALKNLDGKPLPGKEWSDAEGLALMADGSMLVSFEGHHRIWRYPANGGPPQAVPSPAVDFPENSGMEALAADPAAGADADIVGAEETGRTRRCRLAAGCVDGPTVPLADGFNLVAVRRMSAGRTVWLLRSYDAARGARIELRITDPAGQVIDSFRLAAPLTVDNFEAVAAVERAGAPVRFYLLSDDNFSRFQKTLLLAFDWTPAQGVN
jgi:hypothetical protein